MASPILVVFISLTIFSFKKAFNCSIIAYRVELKSECPELILTKRRLSSDLFFDFVFGFGFFCRFFIAVFGYGLVCFFMLGVMATLEEVLLS